MDLELDDSPFRQGFWGFEFRISLVLFVCLFVCVLFSFHFDVFLVVEKRGVGSSRLYEQLVVWIH